MHDPGDYVVWKSLNEATDRAKANWNQIFPWLKSLVLRRIKSFRFDSQSEDDIVIHVAAALITRAALTSLGELRSWIGRVAYNKAVDLYRAKKRRPLVELSEDIGAQEGAGDAEENLKREREFHEQHDLLGALQVRAATQLQKDERRLFELLLLYRKPERGYVVRIASQLGISPNAAHQRIFRLRKKMRTWREEMA